MAKSVSILIRHGAAMLAATIMANNKVLRIFLYLVQNGLAPM
jgi:hypothetical protein